MAIKKVNARLLSLIVGILLAYPVIGNILIVSGVAERMISWKPEKLTIQWRSAWTLVPGYFHIEDLELSSTTVRGNRFNLSIDSGSISLSLIPLITRTISIRKAHGDGVEVSYIQNPKNKKVKLPSILTEQNSSASVIQINSEQKPNPLTAQKSTKPPWTIRLTNIFASNIRKADFNEMTLEGSGQLDALTMYFVTRGGHIEISNLQVGMAVGGLSQPQDSTGILQISADLSVAKNILRENRGKNMLKFWSGMITAKGDLENLGRTYFLPNALYNFGAGGSGYLDAKVVLKDGEVIDGSRLAFQSENFQTTFLALEASGSGQIQGSVDAKTEHPVRLQVAIDDFHLTQGGQSEAYLEGKNLVASVRIPRLYLYHQELENQSQFSFDVGEGVIRDIAHYNAYIPRQSGLKFLSGTGILRGGMTLNGGTAEGSITLIGEEVSLIARDREIHTAFELSANLTEGDYGRKTYRLRDTVLRLHDTQLVTLGRKTEKDWWGEFVIGEGDLIWDQPMKIDGRMSLTMRDVEPLIAGFRDPAKKKSPLDKMLNVKNVQGQLIAHTQEDHILLDPILIDSKGLEVISRVSLSHGSANGVLFAKLRGVSANVEIIDSKVKFRGLGGRHKILQQVNMAALEH